jgi:hypothetical protein
MSTGDLPKWREINEGTLWDKNDVIGEGYASSNSDIQRKIEAGLLPRPFRLLDTQRSPRKWFAVEVIAAAKRRQQLGQSHQPHGGGADLARHRWEKKRKEEQAAKAARRKEVRADEAAATILPDEGK